MNDTSRPRPIESLQVLIVDDEHRLREMLCQSVSDMGYKVVLARTAEQALKMLEASPADIAILDLNLPNRSGLELFEEICQRWPNTHVVILTGFGNLEAAQRAIRMNAVDFLTKPCVLSDLELALNRARHRLGDSVGNVIDPLLISSPEASEPVRLDQLEQQHIMNVLEKNKGNRALTAAELGISQRTLYYRLARYQRDPTD